MEAEVALSMIDLTEKVAYANVISLYKYSCIWMRIEEGSNIDDNEKY